MKQFIAKRKNILLVLLAIMPALLLAALIFKYGVNLIYWDEWEFATAFREISQGHSVFNALFSQQVESRMFFPKLIILAISRITHWDVRYEMAFSLFLLCLVSFNIYRLSRSTVAGSASSAIFLLFLSNLLIFSPAQAYNLLTGHQLVVFMPIACVTTCAVIAYSKNLGPLIKFFLCAVLCTIGTFSFSNGIVSWMIVLPLIVMAGVKNIGDIKKTKFLCAAWAICFLLNLALYFYKYVKPPLKDAPSFSDVFINPLVTGQYFLALLGSPVSFGHLNIATMAGLLTISLWIMLGYHLVKIRRTNMGELRRVAAWLMIGMYTVISAFIITFGRVGWSINNPMPPSRYTSFSVYIMVSLFYLSAIYFEYAAPKNDHWLNARPPRIFFTFLILIFIFLQIKAYIAGIAEMGDLRKDRLKGRACLMFINTLEKKSELNQLVYPRIECKKETIDYINRLGCINPPLINSDRINDIAGNVKQGQNYGYFSYFKNVNADTYEASGWAVLPDGNKPADAVILTYEDSGRDPRMFELSCDIGKAKKYKNPLRQNAVWEIKFSASRLPKGKFIISAWALDAVRGKAFKLNNDRAVEIK